MPLKNDDRGFLKVLFTGAAGCIAGAVGAPMLPEVTPVLDQLDMVTVGGFGGLTLGLIAGEVIQAIRGPQ